uniref:Putative testicular haploid n=1 Tax=Aedes albopictus TaxID=7160 RepID=A0A023EQJ5_AEDAL
MVACFSEDKNVKVPNFSDFRKSFLYTPCNCPLVDCEFSGQQRKVSTTRKYRTSRRIRKLAKPKCRGAKFYQRPVSQYGRTIQMIRAYQEPHASTRIQQLALPKVRKLIAARDAYRRFINRCWYDRFGKRIKRSMFTVYSRLANVHLPSTESKLIKMTPEQWKQHQQWLSKNAQPKPLKKPETKSRKRMPLIQLLDRVMDLSTPRWKCNKYDGPAKFRAVLPGALKATASDRVKALCQPKERHRRAKGPYKEDLSIPKGALEAVATQRVLDLAQPKIYRNVKNEYRENPFMVDPRALKAKAGDRILELAKPKKVKK